MAGHLIGNLVPGVGNLTKKISKVQMPGGLPGGGCLSFELIDTLGPPQTRDIVVDS